MPARQLEIMACVFIFGSHPIFLDLAVKEQKDVENKTDPCYADRIALYVTRCIFNNFPSFAAISHYGSASSIPLLLLDPLIFLLRPEGNGSRLIPESAWAAKKAILNMHTYGISGYLLGNKACKHVSDPKTYNKTRNALW